MTDREIQLVKSTWKLFRGISPALIGETFYSKLFMDHPELRQLFPRSMDDQYCRLVEMINVIVARLNSQDALTAELQPLATKHIRFGVRKEHYQMIGTTMFWTLKQGLGNDWTEEVSRAWAHCYELVSGIMTGTITERN